MKVGGALLTLAGLVAAYFFIPGPIEEAKRTGVLHQGGYGLVMPILLVCAGVAQLVSDLRDEKTMRAGPEGRLLWTRRGLIVIYGMWATAALMVLGWYFFVRLIGLKISF